MFGAEHVDTIVNCIVLVCNVFAALIFWMMFHHKRHEMSFCHRLAYIVVAAGLGLNVVAMFAAVRAPLEVGEVTLSIGLALFAWVMAIKNAEGLKHYRRAAAWF